MKFDYDLIVIGGGASGLVGSKLALGLGKKVLIIEKNRFGGECTWTGCVPSKAIIRSAQVAYQARHSEKYGLSNPHNFSTDSVMKHVQFVVKKVYSTHTPETIKSLGIDTIIGSATFLDNYTVEVDGKKITSKKFLIATGSRPFVPPIERLESSNYLTNETLFSLEKLPKSMVIIGGGPIGMEMGCAYSYLGTKVHVVEMQDRILPREDKELATILEKKLQDDGLNIFTQTQVMKVEDGLVTCKRKNGEEKVETEAVLVAVGRSPNVEDMGLEAIGVDYNRKGIVVNNHLRTSVKNIYASGDVVGPYQFSHMAEHQAMVAIQNTFLPFNKKMDYKNVVWATFTSPEIAATGLTEEEARERYGDSIKVYKQGYEQFDRAVTDVEEVGLGKFICDKRGKLLGAHILGNGAGEIIHEALLAKREGIKFSKLHWMIHVYPTYSEIVKKAARKAYIDEVSSKFFVKLAKKLFGRAK